MSNKIGEWLQRDPQPIDVYALLGRPRFDPDRQQLLVDVRVAYSELLPYQNHTNPELVCRALRLQMELGRAEAIISSPEKLRAHHIELVEDLCAAYATAKGEVAADWSLEQIASWLAAEHAVHPSRLGVVARLVSRKNENTLERDLRETLESAPPLRTDTSEPREEQQPALSKLQATRIFRPQPPDSVRKARPTPPPETPEQNQAACPRLDMAVQWYYKVMGEQFGPETPSGLRRLVHARVISPDTLVKNGTDGDWVYAERVKGLFGSLDGDWQAPSKMRSDVSVSSPLPTDVPPVPVPAPVLPARPRGPLIAACVGGCLGLLVIVVVASLMMLGRWSGKEPSKPAVEDQKDLAQRGEASPKSGQPDETRSTRAA